MKKIILSLLITTSAYASSTFTCWDNECFTKGYTEERNGQLYDYQCLRGDCLTEGVIKNETYIVCKNKNCLKDGFYEIKRSNQDVVSESVCIDSDCRRNGYVEYGKQHTLTITCKENDCLGKGWFGFQNGQVVQNVTCFENDCSHFGWHNSR